jgi:hypothetical protein
MKPKTSQRSGKKPTNATASETRDASSDLKRRKLGHSTMAGDDSVMFEAGDDAEHGDEDEDGAWSDIDDGEDKTENDGKKVRTQPSPKVLFDLSS